jgi:hypothetical protein
MSHVESRTAGRFCGWAVRGGLLLVAAFPIVLGDPAAGSARAEEAVSWLDRLRRSREALEWTDELVRHDWRVQRRVADDSCRLLDPRDRVVHRGTADACRAAFTALQRDGTVPELRGTAVILLHGLGEGRDSMRPLATHLRGAVEAHVMSFGYASTGADIDAHARALATVVSDLSAVDELWFVGHSLGNLVVRRWLAVADPADVARARRLVMLGPPNQGSDLARMVATVWPLAAQAAGAARDLVVDWPRVAPTLAVPTFPCGIVAGGCGDGEGYSRLLPGDDDAVVRVDETRLPGATDFLVVPVRHAAMMRHEVVQRATVDFLRTGRFAAAPITTPGADE